MESCFGYALDFIALSISDKRSPFFLFLSVVLYVDMQQ